MSTTSGSSRRALCDRLARRSPPRRRPRCPARRRGPCAGRSRTSAWSSTSRTRMLIERQRDPRRARRSRRPLPARASSSPPSSARARASRRARARRRRRPSAQARRRRSPAERVGGRSDTSTRVGTRPGVLDRVGQRLLDDPVGRAVDADRRARGAARHGEVDVEPGRAHALDELVQVAERGLRPQLRGLVLVAQHAERARASRSSAVRPVSSIALQRVARAVRILVEDRAARPAPAGPSRTTPWATTSCSSRAIRAPLLARRRGRAARARARRPRGAARAPGSRGRRATARSRRARPEKRKLCTSMWPVRAPSPTARRRR